MIEETALGFYTHRGVTVAIVSSQRIPCLFHERQRHMVKNHSGMYSDFQPSISSYINTVLKEADLLGPYATTQNRIESGKVVYLSQDLLLSMRLITREMLYEQIRTTYRIAGFDTQELHNWHIRDDLQDSIDRYLIREYGVLMFESYLYALVKAQVKSENPGAGWITRWRLEAGRRTQKDFARRMETAKAVRAENKQKKVA